jgi:hypothetical protein
MEKSNIETRTWTNEALDLVSGGKTFVSHRDRFTSV